jgi:hypothetical protein
MNHLYQKPVIRSLYLPAIVLFSVTQINVAQANQDSVFYRWIDKKGSVHYSDKIIPDFAGYRRDQINDRGITVKTIERAKTPEERAKQRKLLKLRQQQQKLVAQQAARDRLLLYTFEDVTNSLGDKLSTIDSKLKIIRNSIKQLTRQLNEQKKSAAQWEKSGRAVPKTVLFKIDEIQNMIASYEAAVVRHSAKREQLQQGYAKDTQRYKRLVSHQYEKINADKLTHAIQGDEQLSIISCSSKQQCKKAWQLTKEYLINNPAGKKLITDSNLVASTAAPADQNDIGASAVLIKKGPEQSTIFLDIHCKQTVVGQERCNSKHSKNWLNGFRVYVLSRLQS